MRRKIFNVFKTFILGLIISLSSVDTCNAVVDLNALQGYLNGVISQQQINQSNNPKYADRNNSVETVDPLTGNLILKQTDLYLTGKDGLDLLIGRMYNSSQNECDKKVNLWYTVKTELVYVSGYAVDVYSYNSNTNTWTSTAVRFNRYEDAYAFYSSFPTDGNSTVFATSPYAKSYPEYQDVYTVNVDNYTDKYSYNKVKYNLGAGWSFLFPSVQFAETWYYHDGSGSAYEITGYTDLGTSNLKGYQGNDVKFIQDNGSYQSGEGTTSGYKFIDSEKTTTYFGHDGRVLGIKDRFNNEIKFWYENKQIYHSNYPLISKIQDSIGRVVNFTYSGNYIYLTVSAPNETNQLSITYERSFATKNVYKNGSIYDVYQYPILESVTDTMGRKTYYENYYNYNNNTWPSVKFSFYEKDLNLGPTEDCYLLGAVVYPGSKTLYEYEKVTRNLGANGLAEAYRIKSRYDRIERKNTNTGLMEWLPACNRADYTYGGDYSGYPTCSSDEYMTESFQFWSQVALSNGMNAKTIFNGCKQAIQVETTASNNEKKIVKNLEFYASYVFLPTKVETSEYAGDGTLGKRLYSGYTYNSWGGLIESTFPLTLQQFEDPSTKALYTTTYSYEDPNFKQFITKKQWYQNSNTLLDETYSYDTLGKISQYKNAKGEITTYSYYIDSNNNKVTQSTQNIENSRTATSKLVYGNETGYAYPKEVKRYYTNALDVYTETKSTMTYNLLFGLVKTETNNENKTTSYTYDNLGRVTCIQLPDFTNENGVTYSARQDYQYIDGYNEEYIEGNYKGIYGTTVTSKTCYTNKASGATNYYNQISALYDAYGNLRQEKSWGGTQYITKAYFTYDNLQRVVSCTDASGLTVTQTYNPWGQVKEVMDPLGNITVNDYDMKSNKVMSYFVASSNISGYRTNTTANTYKEDYTEIYLDQFGQAISRKAYENWPTMSGELSELYSYDIVGNLKGYTDPKRNLNGEGFTTAYKCDALNRITEVKDAQNQVTNVNYTVLGNISSITLKQTSDSANIVTLYTKSYNELGAVTSKTDPSAQAAQYSYNTIGLNTQNTDRNGSTSSLTYDGINQISRINQVSSDGLKNIAYKYVYSKPFGYDEEKLYVNGVLSSNTSYNYNSDGQVTKKNITGSGSISSGLDMQYDNSGRLISEGTGIQGSGYFYTDYKYTSGRLTQVQTNGQQTVSTSDADNATYDYYPDGKLKKITYPRLNDGSLLTTEYVYNPLGRMTSMANKKGGNIFSQYSYTYDANGNIITVNDGTTTKTYVYDKLNRLISIIPQTGKATTYAYDLMGNRLTESSDRISMNFTYTSYAYRLDNQLESVTKGSTTSMEYYADGLRSKKTTSSGMTHYIYDLSGRLVAEGQSSTAISTNYVWGPDRVLTKKDSSGGIYYYLYNGHGDVVQMVDRNGNMVNNYQYDEWGNILMSNETINNPFKYAGEVYDQETGLYYLRARYYDPSVGRFLSEDSYEGQVNNPLSLNMYTYCYNNPSKYIDPSGHIPTIDPITDLPIVIPFPWGDGSNYNSWPCPYPKLVNYNSNDSWGEIFSDGLNQLDNTIKDGLKKVSEVVFIITFPVVVKATEIIISSKGAESYKDTGSLGDAQVKDLKPLPKNKIEELGGEDYTQPTKKDGGKSKSDLYWNPKTGDVYTIPKAGGPPQYIDTLPIK